MALAGIFSFSKEEISVSLIAYLLAICFQVGSLGRLFLLSKSITACLVSASSSCNPLNPNEAPENQVNSRLKQEIIISQTKCIFLKTQRDKWGGGGGPGLQKKNVSALRASVWSKNKGGGA